MFKKQEKILIVICVVVAAICLYGAIKGFMRYMDYFG